MNEDLVQASRYASRKFLITVWLLLSNLGLLLVDRMDAAQYLNSAAWLAGLYFGANALTWATEVLRPKT